jgi:hypothetical protein
MIETATMAPRNSPALALIYDREKQKGQRRSSPLAEQKTTAGASHTAQSAQNGTHPLAVKAAAQAARPGLPFKLNIPDQLLDQERISPEPVLWNRVCIISHAKLDCGFSQVGVVRFNKRKREHNMMVSPMGGFLFAFWHQEYSQRLV